MITNFFFQPAKFMKQSRAYTAALVGLTALVSAPDSLAQPEVMPWGNLRGIYVQGERMNFETSIRSVFPDWSGCVSSEKCNWQGKPTYAVEGKTTTISHFLQARPLNYTTKISETGSNSASIELSIEAKEDMAQAGTYFCFELPGNEFDGGVVEIVSGQATNASVTLGREIPAGKTEYIRATGNKIIARTASRSYEVTTDRAMEIFIKQNYIDRPSYLNDPLPVKQFVASDSNQPVANYQVYFTMIDGNAKSGDQRSLKCEVRVAGSVDKEDVRISIDPKQPGRPFAGIGGNFRLGNRENEAKVIDYCMNHLRVAWSRVPLDWVAWQPNESDDPIANARAGKLPKQFYDQIALAQRLARLKIPIILSVWAPPTWAVDASKQNRKGLEHDPKISLNPKHIDNISKSFADYLWYLKVDYGVEVKLFSFNEPDYGVQVFETPEEHAWYIKMIGQCFAARGLVTKMLLGDTGAGTARANKIVMPAVNDPSIHQYIGAIAFHTYHGCTPVDLMAWAASAKELNIPILVDEGGPNSGEHRYPQNFLDKWFQLSEIDLYVRICRYSQPATIMEWQLTPDYSVLIGDGLYGDQGSLRPTQRFWNLKQLGSTPENAFSIPVEVDRPNITTAAFADVLDGWYTVHIVNNGAQRKARVEGFPTTVKDLNVYKTDLARGMEQGEIVPVKDGVAEVILDEDCYTTLSNARFR